MRGIDWCLINSFFALHDLNCLVGGKRAFNVIRDYKTRSFSDAEHPKYFQYQRFKVKQMLDTLFGVVPDLSEQIWSRDASRPCASTPRYVE